MGGVVVRSSAADSKNSCRDGELRVEFKVAGRPNLVIARFRFIDVPQPQLSTEVLLELIGPQAHGPHPGIQRPSSSSRLRAVGTTVAACTLQMTQYEIFLASTFDSSTV
jgi:hypothetical protein